MIATTGTEITTAAIKCFFELVIMHASDFDHATDGSFIKTQNPYPPDGIRPMPLHFHAGAVTKRSFWPIRNESRAFSIIVKRRGVIKGRGVTH
jgi:hypothetical protein